MLSLRRDRWLHPVVAFGFPPEDSRPRQGRNEDRKNSDDSRVPGALASAAGKWSANAAMSQSGALSIGIVGSIKGNAVPYSRGYRRVPPKRMYGDTWRSIEVIP